LAEPTPSGRNNPWLDLIRALAIIMVIFRHGERALQPRLGGTQDILQTIFMNGWIGVDLFFALSGYLIARHLLRAGIGSPEFRIGRYLALRALRILPAYYTVLLLVVVGSIPLFAVSQHQLGLRVAYHLLFLQDYLPSDINVVFWSLGVEEKFYLLAPLLVLLLLKCRSTAAWTAVLLALFFLPSLCRAAIFLPSPDGWDYTHFWRTFRSPFHMSLEGLIIGVGIAMAELKGLVRPSTRSGLALIAGSGVLFAVWMGTGDFMAKIDGVDVLARPPLIAVLIGAMLLGGVKLSRTPMPIKAPVQAIARLSYSLYLIHFPLIPLATAFGLPAGAGGFWLAYLVLSGIGASLLHTIVEKPFLVWKDQLARREHGRASLTVPHLSEV